MGSAVLADKHSMRLKTKETLEGIHFVHIFMSTFDRGDEQLGIFAYRNP